MMTSYYHDYGLLILLITIGTSTGALPDDDVTCPMISDVSCPAIATPGSDDVIQMVPKRLSADHPLGDLPELDGIELRLICAQPDCLSNPCLNGGTCKETYNGYKCLCTGSHAGINCQLDRCLKDCAEISQAGQTTNGVYQICISPETEDRKPINVYCNIEGNTDGWLVIQRRYDGTVDFYQDWAAYKDGFGDLETEFWLGNDIIHRITHQKPYKLRIDMVDIAGNPWKSVYNNFSVTNESDGYRLNALFISGDAGDSLTYHEGQQFTTRDRDNDVDSSSNCAVSFEGAWWYNSCYHSNLNGRWSYSEIYPDSKGIRWNAGVGSSMRATTMEIRPMD